MCVTWLAAIAMPCAGDLQSNTQVCKRKSVAPSAKYEAPLARRTIRNSQRHCAKIHLLRLSDCLAKQRQPARLQQRRHGNCVIGQCNIVSCFASSVELIWKTLMSSCGD